jgi:predicted transcriptional regulator
MEAPLPEVQGKASIEEVSKLFSNGATAVVVNYDGDKKHIITYQDVIRAIA